MRKLVLIPILTCTTGVGWCQEFSLGRPNLPGQVVLKDPEMMRATSPRKKKSKGKKADLETPVPAPQGLAEIPDSVPRINVENESPNISSTPFATSDRLTPNEAFAACYNLLRLPPPFEEATIRFPTNMAILLVDPHAYQGSMSPFSGVATWSQPDGRTHKEPIASRGGYLVLRWPSKALGSPNPGTLNLRMDRPTLATQFLWSDFTLYGSDIPKLLLQQVPNWDTSPRKLDLVRTGYREALFPPTLQAGIHDPAVGPVLEPLLQQAAPQLLHQLKGGFPQ